MKGSNIKKLLAMNEDIILIKMYYGIVDDDGLEYDELCVHPSDNIPERYKILKFETFTSTENSMAHLRRYND